MTRPNVLLICVDHWPGPLMGVAGHERILTPTLNQFAANGVLYTQTWRGNTIVDIKPGGKWIPMFHRPQLNMEQVPTR